MASIVAPSDKYVVDQGNDGSDVRCAGMVTEMSYDIASCALLRSRFGRGSVLASTLVLENVESNDFV